MSDLFGTQEIEYKDDYLTIEFPFRAMKQLQERIGEGSLQKAGKRLSGDDVEALEEALFAGLQKHHRKEFKKEDVEEIIDEVGFMEVLEKVNFAFVAFMAKGKEKEDLPAEMQAVLDQMQEKRDKKKTK